jgi:hypothetical protein
MFFRPLPLLVSLAPLALCGCHMVLIGMFAPSTYSPGTVGVGLARSSHAVTTIGRVDVAVALVKEESRTVLEWRMGNGDDSPVQTDLSALRVTARGEDGIEARVPLVDPNKEIGPMPLAARRAALERIALRLPDGTRKVCVSMAGVVAGAGAPSPCFTLDGDWHVEAGAS